MLLQKGGLSEKAGSALKLVSFLNTVYIFLVILFHS